MEVWETVILGGGSEGMERIKRELMVQQAEIDDGTFYGFIPWYASFLPSCNCDRIGQIMLTSDKARCLCDMRCNAMCDAFRARCNT
jgi:hypothetical protein